LAFQFNFQSASSQDSIYHGLLDSYDVKFYFLDLNVNNTSIDLDGRVSILAELLESDIDSLALELRQEVTIDSIWIDGNLSSYIHSDDFVRFALPSGYEKNDLVQMTVFYKVHDIETDRRIGIFNRQSIIGKSVTYTLSEPYFSSSWFPCKQVLADKADSVYVFLSIGDSLMAGSNGILSNVSLLENGRKRYEWKSYYPVAYYLISFSVADYLDYSFMASLANGDSVLVQNYLYNDSLYFLENKNDIDATAGMIELFSQDFGTYPFYMEKYGHCVSPVSGGMEHQTMTTLGNFSFTLVAHELAHQWFGNNVTCSDWQNIWINEGFASYCEYIAYEFLLPGYISQWLRDAQTYVMQDKEGSVFVPDNELDNMDRIFDYRLSYRKGALLLHMLRHELGDDELFFSVLQSFMKKYSGSVASAEDFKEVVNELSQRDFTVFFDQWFYGEGYPILMFTWEQKHDTLYIYAET
jgi:aminopeptidase N